MRRVTSDLGPGGQAEGPGWTALRRKTETDQGWDWALLRQLEVQVGVRQVAGEWVAAGDPQEGLEALACLPRSGPQGLLGDLHGSWGGERGAGGDEESWRTQAQGRVRVPPPPGELGSTEGRASLVTFEPSALPR